MAECVYVHIPFCLRKCFYCDFLSVPFEGAIADSYVSALAREIRLSQGGALRTLYVGGGTPTVLSGAQIKEIFAAIGERFDVQPDVEITVEANPGTMDRGKAGALRALGINRLSLGVQSFDDMELKTLGRVHTSREAEEAARECGFGNLSLDLIYGIPGQTMESWLRTLDMAVGLGPTHVSAYELTPEACTPLMDSIERGSVKMPDEELVLDMFHAAGEALGRAGLGHYEISNYALPGRECRHNLNYWLRGEYLGLGAGAHSFDGDRRTRNTGDIGDYVRRMEAGQSPVADSEELTRAEARREFLLLGLRLTRGVHVCEFDRQWGMALEEAAGGLVEEGLMELRGGRLRLTGRGLPLFNPVVVRLFEALGL